MNLRDAENTVLSTKGKEGEGCSVTHVSTAALTHVFTTDAVVSGGARTGDTTSLELKGCNKLALQHYMEDVTAARNIPGERFLGGRRCGILHWEFYLNKFYLPSSYIFIFSRSTLHFHCSEVSQWVQG